MSITQHQIIDGDAMSGQRSGQLSICPHMPSVLPILLWHQPILTFIYLQLKVPKYLCIILFWIMVVGCINPKENDTIYIIYILNYLHEFNF